MIFWRVGEGYWGRKFRTYPPVILQKGWEIGHGICPRGDRVRTPGKWQNTKTAFLCHNAVFQGRFQREALGWSCLLGTAYIYIYIIIVINNNTYYYDIYIYINNYYIYIYIPYIYIWCVYIYIHIMIYHIYIYLYYVYIYIMYIYILCIYIYYVYILCIYIMCIYILCIYNPKRVLNKHQQRTLEFSMSSEPGPSTTSKGKSLGNCEASVKASQRTHRNVWNLERSIFPAWLCENSYWKRP